MADEITRNPTNKTEAPRKPARFAEIEPDPFDGDLNSKIVTEEELCKVILPRLFAASFHDFIGCDVQIMDGSNPLLFNTGIPTGTLYLDLYFKWRGEAPENGPIKNLEYINPPASAKNEDKNDIYSRLMRVSGGMTSTRIFKVTKETYEMLTEFSFNGNLTRWENQTQEVAMQGTAYSKDEVVTRISGISLNAAIAKIYGEEDKENNCKYVYDTHRATINAMDPRSLNIQITRLDLNSLARFQANNGIYNLQKADNFYVYR